MFGSDSSQHLKLVVGIQGVLLTISKVKVLTSSSLKQLKRRFISFLSYNNKDFSEKYPTTISSIRYLNIDVLYSGFIVSQR